MYETMVKEAYNNIVGFEKEAGVGYNRLLKDIADRGALRSNEKADRKELAMDQRNARTIAKKDLRNKKTDDNLANYGGYIDSVNASNDAAVAQYDKLMQLRNQAKTRATELKNQKRSDKAKKLADTAELYNQMNDEKAKNLGRTSEIVKQMRGQRAENTIAGRSINHSLMYGDAAEMAGLKAKQRAHRLDLAEQRKAEKAAEKAAAYYDEAQFMKQAAEEDYLEACAYEDAAIEILDELGYLD